MVRTTKLLLAVGLLTTGVLLGAEAAKPVVKATAAANAAAPKANLQLIMLGKVNPQGLALWDITNNAMNDAGGVDARKVTPAQWAKLLEIGKALEEGGRLLATSNGIVAAPPGAKLQDEGGGGSGASARDVQRYLDAQPAVFRAHALELQQTGAGIVTAATKRDAKLLGSISDKLDMVCETCHVIFWYPQQKK